MDHGELNGLTMGTPNSTAADQGPAWYVVRIRNQHEAKVESGLRGRGMEVFVPRITVRSRRKDRVKLLEAPLFSCYMFVYTRMSPAAYNAIIRQSGVAGIVGGKGYCTPVPADAVAAIRSITGSGKPCYHWTRLVPGPQVQVVAGSLSGARGTVYRHDSGKRYLVAGVELLGQSVAVELDEEVDLVS